MSKPRKNADGTWGQKKEADPTSKWNVIKKENDDRFYTHEDVRLNSKSHLLGNEVMGLTARLDHFRGRLQWMKRDIEGILGKINRLGTKSEDGSVTIKDLEGLCLNSLGEFQSATEMNILCGVISHQVETIKGLARYEQAEEEEGR